LNLSERHKTMENLLRNINDLRTMYNTPGKSEGIPWPLASEILCLYNPKVYSIYRGKLTLNAIKYLFEDVSPELKKEKTSPDPPDFHLASLGYINKTLELIRSAGVSDANYR